MDLELVYNKLLLYLKRYDEDFYNQIITFDEKYNKSILNELR
ncbi:MAG: hypothetical protein P1U46_02090 [Patescibacteria group bacterium]|nr:hypothetical protein [Patescibacteria group bacterium]